MGSFSTRISGMRNSENEFEDYAGQAAGLCDSIESIRSSLEIPAVAQDQVQRNLRQLLERCEQHRAALLVLSGKMGEIVSLYVDAEQRIQGEPPAEAAGSAPTEAAPAEISPMEEGWESLQDYLLDAIEQVLFGSFTDSSNLLGIVGSVLVGCTPVGWIADIRDIFGDIYQIAKDGGTTAEWITLAVDVVAIIPGADILKYSDEFADFLKHADNLPDVVKKGGDIIEGVTDYTRGVWKSADDIISKVDDVTDNIFKKVDDVLPDLPESVQEGIDKAYNTLQKEIGESTVGGAIKDVAMDAVDLEGKIIDGIASGIDSLFGGNEEEAPVLT